MRREGVAGGGQGGDCQRGRGGEDGSPEGKEDMDPRRKCPPESVSGLDVRIVRTLSYFLYLAK